MDRRLGPENAVNMLVNTLNRRGLAAYAYKSDGIRYVHVSPPHSPAAGTDLKLQPDNGGRYCFFTEWGSPLGGHLPAVACRVMWWFGKRSPRH